MMKQQSGVQGEMNQLMKCIDQVDQNLNLEQIPSKVLLLMGQTKAGKTTLMYYLLKKPLLLEQDEKLGVQVMKPEAKFLDYAIGDGYGSTTVYPNIPPPENEDDCLIIDMPGFSDTRPLYRLLSIYIILKTIAKIKNVHVCFVIPEQNLDQEPLLISLERTCKLLNSSLKKASKCFSFILTKVQDKEEVEDRFTQIMESFKEEEDIQKDVLPLIENFGHNNTYIFSSESPDVEEGGLLKQKILEQNTFYPINEKVENFLSEQYSQVIVGQQNEEFNAYITDLLNYVDDKLPKLLSIVTMLIQYHEYNWIAQGLEWEYSQLRSIKSQLAQKLQQLTIADICQINPDFQDKEEENNEFSLISLLKKMKILLANESSSNFEKMQFICDVLKEITQEQSGISQDLRKKIYFAFKNSLMILLTLKEIKNPEIEEEIERIFSLEIIEETISSFEEIFNEEVLKKIVNIPEAQSFIAENEEMNSLVQEICPNTLSSAPSIVKYKYERSQDKLKDKTFLNSFSDTVKSVKEEKDRSQSSKGKKILPEKAFKLQNISKSLKQLQANGQNLKMLIKSAVSWERKTQKLSSDENINKIKAWQKIISLLQDSRMLEEAILFSMALFDLTKIELLIGLGIKYNEISTDFVKEFLIPFYSQIENNFNIIEKLFGYCLANTNRMEQMAKIDMQMVRVIKVMRENIQKNAGKSQFARKRFNLSYVEYLISDQGLSDLISRVNSNIVKLGFSELHHLSTRKVLLKLKTSDL